MSRIRVRNMHRRKVSLSVVGFILLASVAGYAQAADVTLPTIDVTANRITQPWEHAHADVSVVTRKQIETMHMEHVEDALRITPGVQFLNYGANGLNANLSGVRINGSKNIIVAVDGHRVSAFEAPDSTGYMFASVLNNMEGIQRIEVLRGAQSTLYGSGAQGGVINIVTRKITKNSTMLSTSGGTAGSNLAFSTMGKRGPISYLAYVNQNYTGDMTDGSGKLWPGHSDIDSKGVKITAYHGKHDLSTEIESLHASFAGREFLYKEHYTGDYQYHRFSLQDVYHANAHVENNLFYRLNGVKFNYLEMYFNTSKKPDPVHENTTYQFLSDTVHYTDAHNQAVGGIEYSYAKTGTPVKLMHRGEKYVTPDGKEINPDIYDGPYSVVYPADYRRMHNTSYFVYDAWKFAPRWTFTGGIRRDVPKADQYCVHYDPHTSKSYQLAVQLSKKDSVYAGKSDFYVLPSMMQEADPEHGNSNLLPAYGYTKTVGWTHVYSPNSFLTANWFNTYTERSIGFGQNKVYHNYKGGVARGWNVQFTTQLNPAWFAQVGYAHLFQYDPGSANFSYGYYPKDMVTFDVMYKKHKWNVGLDGFYFVRRVDPEKGPQGWPHTKFGVYNLSVNYQAWEHAQLFVVIHNIGNTLWAEQTNVIWQGGKPGDWYAQPGRTILFGVKAKF